MVDLLKHQPSFGQRLFDATERRGALCVGIDPHPALLSSWGFADDIAGLKQFVEVCVTAFADVAAVVKPQIAFFERFGSAGFTVLEDAIAALRASGVLVLADAKRGDIGSTMAAYAQAWLGEDSALSADAVTVSPYLGYGSLGPVFELAEQNGGGVFVLAATSNPEGWQIQQAQLQGRTVSQMIVDQVAESNIAAQPLGSVGVVVGATLGQAPDLSRLGGPILMPGIGAQGGTVADVRRLAEGVLRAVLPSVSREILAAGPSVTAVRGATEQLVDKFSFVLD
ncbi:MAG: orotidine-5'-phosphate decarboxylase [Mycobacteriaceae bacterium]